MMKTFKFSFQLDTWAGSFDDARKKTNFEETLQIEDEYLAKKRLEAIIRVKKDETERKGFRCRITSSNVIEL